MESNLGMSALSNGYFAKVSVLDGQQTTVFVVPGFQLNLISADLISHTRSTIIESHLSLHDLGCGYLMTRAVSKVSLGIGKYYFEVTGLVIESIVPGVAAVLGRDFHERLRVSQASSYRQGNLTLYRIRVRPFTESVILDCELAPEGINDSMLFIPDGDYRSKLLE